MIAALFDRGRAARTALLPVAGWSLALVAPLVAATGCSLGQGTGCFTNSSLDAPTCWSGPFDLQPDFFAAVTTNSAALEIRIQNGLDNETFSDGLIILVDDVGEVRGDPLPDGTARSSLLGQPLAVALPPSVTPPGVPVKAVANPARVHASLYLNRTCRTRNVALYAFDAVSLEADGTCNRPDSGTEPAVACGGSAATPDVTVDGGAEAGTTATGVAASSWCATCPCPAASPMGDAAVSPPNIGTSVIRFTKLFDGNASESNAQQRLTAADFDLYLADPHEICPGGLGPPPRCRGHLQGHFQFYFQRGRPAQPFP